MATSRPSAAAVPGERFPPLPRLPPRHPAIAVALALAAGIAIDRHWAWPAPLWTASATIALAAAIVLARWGWRRGATVALLAGCLLLGGLRGHVGLALRPADDVSHLLGEEPRLVRLSARLATPVTILAPRLDPLAPAWRNIDRSVAEAECRALIAGQGIRRPLSGRIRIESDGHLLHLEPGDEFEVVGRLRRPATAANPLGFDHRAWLRDRGIDGIVSADHPDAFQLAQRPTGLAARLSRWPDRLRGECRAVLVRHLGPGTRPVATSLLIGDRSLMSDELRQAFIESGTMHVLAISGMHVAILAGLLFGGCRWLNLSLVATAGVLLGGVGLYALLTDHRAPVLRATVLAVITVGGWLSGRGSSAWNALALSAALILAWRPAELFDVGAQLSFLAVAGIIWSTRIIARWRSRRAPQPDLSPERGPWRQRIAYWGRWIAEAYFVTLAVWLFTAPLLACRFHLLAPVGFLINVLLMPLSTVMLGLGFLTLAAGLLAPPLAWLPAEGFDLSLRLFLGIVEWSAGTRWGHVNVSGGPEWWLVGFYGLLIGGRMLKQPSAAARWSWRLLAVWTLGGLAVGLRPDVPSGVRCTFLSVGHGLSVLVETPRGQTLLYDAGSITGPDRAVAAVEAALWSRRRAGIDLAVVSHADVDHYNGLPRLLRDVPVGLVTLHRTFLDFEQTGAEAVCDTASQAGVPLRLVQTGDRLRLDPDVEIEILHPAGDVATDVDNANSLVVAIRYAGRTVLLTGDLEAAGLERLVAGAPRQCDVLLSPHHGRIGANPAILARWANPAWVVASTGDAAVESRLASIYGPEATILSTRERGAITIEISPSGRIAASSVLDP